MKHFNTQPFSRNLIVWIEKRYLFQKRAIFSFQSSEQNSSDELSCFEFDYLEIPLFWCLLSEQESLYTWEILWLLAWKDLTLMDPCHIWNNAMNIGRRNKFELERSEGELLINLWSYITVLYTPVGQKHKFCFPEGNNCSWHMYTSPTLSFISCNSIPIFNAEVALLQL